MGVAVGSGCVRWRVEFSRGVVLNFKENALPVSGLVLAMLLWGSSFIAMKVAVAAHDPVWVIFGRMTVASAVFAVFHRRLREAGVVREDWGWLAFMAICEP